MLDIHYLTYSSTSNTQTKNQSFQIDTIKIFTIQSNLYIWSEINKFHVFLGGQPLFCGTFSLYLSRLFYCVLLFYIYLNVLFCNQSTHVNVTGIPCVSFHSTSSWPHSALSCETSNQKLDSENWGALWDGYVFGNVTCRCRGNRWQTWKDECHRLPAMK